MYQDLGNIYGYPFQLLGNRNRFRWNKGGGSESGEDGGFGWHAKHSGRFPFSLRISFSTIRNSTVFLLLKFTVAIYKIPKTP